MKGLGRGILQFLMLAALLALFIALTSCESPTGPSVPGPVHIVAPWEGRLLGQQGAGLAVFDDRPAPEYENRFEFVLQGATGGRASGWTWVRVAVERGGMRIRAEGLLDVWLDTRGGGEEGTYEDLWQHVTIEGARVLVEEPKGDHRSRP